MPRRKRELIKGEFYHLILRRLGNEPLFIDIDDYYRGIFSIYEFNDARSVLISQRRIARTRFKKIVQQIEGGEIPIKIVEPKKSLIMVDKRDLLVEILVFCLMPNHIHLLVREIRKGGISKFMQKLGSGYSSYFKNKYGIKIKGHFFQDRFTAVHIKTEEQLIVVFVYIHTNPISLIEPKWKKLGIANPGKVIKFIENYKWSSYQDYIGKKNFPSLTSRDFLLKIMGGKEGCKKWVEGWIKQKNEIKKIMEKF
ncbi:transposase [Patescibacteria group bacterium]|nr:transposase [Patescibacteria group bacterium]MBU4481382.1 transposase [Patescibacteria group bacterium]